VAKWNTAHDPETPVSQQGDALQACLYDLEELLVQLQPHRIYDALFMWGFAVGLALASGAITQMLL